MTTNTNKWSLIKSLIWSVIAFLILYFLISSVALMVLEPENKTNIDSTSSQALLTWIANASENSVKHAWYAITSKNTEQSLTVNKEWFLSSGLIQIYCVYCQHLEIQETASEWFGGWGFFLMYLSKKNQGRWS